MSPPAICRSSALATDNNGNASPVPGRGSPDITSNPAHGRRLLRGGHRRRRVRCYQGRPADTPIVGSEPEGKHLHHHALGRHRDGRRTDSLLLAISERDNRTKHPVFCEH